MDDATSMAEGLARLEAALAGAGAGVAAFDGDLQRFRDSTALTGREVQSLGSGFSGGLRRAFDGLALDGAKLSDVLKGLGRSMLDTIHSMAMRPVTNALGGAMAQGVAGLMAGMMPFANGGAFAQGRVMPFARGGVVTSPVSFPMRGGARGLMGEAGPEAIMPLARGPDGRLGVAASGGAPARPVQVVFNIATPDVQGFQKSQAQIAAEMGRLLARGQRNR